MNKQVPVSKDVVVDKTKHWDWNHEVENGPTQVLFDSNNPGEPEKQCKCSHKGKKVNQGKASSKKSE